MSEYMIVGGQLYHHGIKGQKWGVRRYQNKDGTRTPAGKKRYADADGLTTWDKEKQLKKTYKAEKKAAGSWKEKREAKKRYNSNVEELYDKNYKMKGDNLKGVVGTYNFYDDRHTLGKKGVARLNDRMNAGESYGKAWAKEYARSVATGYAISAAMMATPVIATAAANSFSNYANQRAVQKANAGLARIGTFKYEKVAKNVYRQVMK